LPLKKSLAIKKRLMDKALQQYDQAAGYGISEVTTAATYHTAQIYSQLGEDEKVVQSYESVKRSNVSPDLLVPAATLAATSMVRIGKVTEAEKLSRNILAKIKSNKTHIDRQGELHRLLARAYSGTGRLTEAVTEAQNAAKAFEDAGDLYHAATAWGFIGDLYRETGDFELARSSFVRFGGLAEKWGDRDLLQVAELAEAWVSLDIGDLTHAAKQIAAVEKEMSVAPSRRLRRYLAAAKALLEAGRGHHEQAAAMLVPVIENWETVGQRNLADLLRAQRVRSLIASNNLDKARSLVDEALARLDAKSAAPRVASFLRESALIRLRRKDAKKAMAELTQARKLFAKGGNRREEAVTLHRIARAALDEGDIPLATARCDEALALAKKIKHPRVIAQCRELQGRIALLQGDPKAAVTAAKEALQSLRRLGDEIGTLHSSETLLHSLIAAGDLAGAIRLGPRVSDQAEKLEIREVRIRAIVLTGVALLRRNRVEPATRCFREVPDQKLSSFTTALMYRLGEGLASVQGDVGEMLARRRTWVTALKRLPEPQQLLCRDLLASLDLPPNDRCLLRTQDENRLVSTEELAWLELYGNVDLYVDVENLWIEDGGERVVIEAPELARLFNRLVIAAPDAVDNAMVYEVAYSQAPPARFETKLKAPLRILEKSFKGSQNVKLSQLKTGVKLELPQSYAFLVPRAIEYPDLKPVQRKILRLLRRHATMPIQAVQDQCDLNRSSARRELGELVELELVETVRDGRGQAFRLA
jgi:tetratricopeptide (TPR) repeat protein